jgi:branched-chain amino acid aminotransferase
MLVLGTSYTPPSAEVYRKGYKALVSPIRQNSESPLSHLKSANYLNNILARKEARGKGADEAILFNERNYLCEGSTSNIFLVARGNLITPNEESGCLPGITRQIVIELATELSIRVTEREIGLEELLNADEAFFTSSLIELMPLNEVDGKTIGSGKRGRVSERLMRAYKELVVRETKVS